MLLKKDAKKRRAKAIAILMISLILTIPLLSTYSFAQAQSPAVNSVKVYGLDNIDGLLRAANDVITIEASISNNGAAVTPDRVTVGTSIPFDSCTLISQTGLNRCIKQIAGQPYGSSVSFDVQLLDLTKTNVMSMNTGAAYVDSTAPQVLLLITPRTNVASGNFNVSVQAVDTACPACPSDKCSGISQIKLYYQQNENLSIFQNVNGNTCIFNSTIEWPGQDPSGQYNICAKAIDRVGLISSPVCSSYTRDTSPPQITAVTIVNAANQTVNFIGSRPLAAVMRATILDDMDFSVAPNATADLRSLNSAYTVPRRADSCIYAAGNEVICSWNINIVQSATTTASIQLNATDSSGNVGSSSFTYALTFDAIAPVASVLKTDYPSETAISVNGNYSDLTYLNTRNNTLYVVFAEAGSGLSSSTVLADLSAMNSAYPGAGTAPSTCYQTATSTWVCVWDNATLGQGIGNGENVAISLVKVEDNAGNLGAQNVFYATADTSPPTLDKYRFIMTSQIATGQTIVNDNVCAVSGSVFTVDMKASEDFEYLLAYANVSKISTMQDGMAMSLCEKQGTDFSCQLQIDKIRSAAQLANVKIVLEDIAGNQAVNVTPIQVCAADATSTSMNFVTFVNTGTKPATIDRKLFNKVGVNIFVPLTFQKANSTAILAYSVDSCNNTKGLTSQPILLNQYGENPVLMVSVANDTKTNFDAVRINCNLFLKIRQGNTLYQNPEVEPVKIIVPFSDNSMGGLEANVKDKIDSTISDINSVNRKIGDAKKADESFKMICNILSLITKIQNLGATLKSLGTAFCVMGPTGNFAYQPLCKIGNQITNFFNPTIMVWTSPLKFMCAKITCRLCDPGAWGNAIVGLGDSYLSKDGKTFGITVPSLLGGNASIGRPTSVPLMELLKTGSVLSGEKFDPYANIHNAEACDCNPARAYNYMKDRQIKCMYVKCLQANLDAGITTRPCEVAYKERECLYYEGATGKSRGLDDLLGKIFVSTFMAMGKKILAKLLTRNCPPLDVGACVTCESTGMKDGICAAIHMFEAFKSLQDLMNGGFDFGFGKGNDQEITLSGTDNCAGITGVDALAGGSSG